MVMIRGANSQTQYSDTYIAVDRANLPCLPFTTVRLQPKRKAPVTLCTSAMACMQPSPMPAHALLAAQLTEGPPPLTHPTFTPAPPPKHTHPLTRRARWGSRPCAPGCLTR
jgi:hypothetical protein